MKRIKRLRPALLLAFILLLSLALDAQAQTRDVNSFVTSIKSLIRGLSDNIVDIALILVGFIGAIMVIPNLIKHSKHDPNASDAFIKLGTGLIVAFVIIQVCRLLF